jgi:DNA polymerase-3 subunit gamma/tau
LNQAATAQSHQQVLYRKWRPRRFVDVVGQAPVVTTLRNAVASGNPAHAYLFTGPRGTGKTSTGRIMAKAVNCEAPVDGEPDDTCVSCRAYDAGQALDLIELDAASNRGIDEIRDLRESAGYAPSSGRYKVYLIDEVHMLTDAAFNALLKTLEEPPPHVIFILATTEPHKIPATIASRCQRFDFRRHTIGDIVEQLAKIAAGEGIDVEDGGFELIARQATGSLRDAVNLLDQLAAYHGDSLDLDAVRAGLGLVVDSRAADLARAAIQRDLKAGLGVLAAARDDGIEIRAFIREVVSMLRTVLHLKAGAGEHLALSDAQVEEMRGIASGADVTDVVAALEAFGSLDFAGDAYDSLPAEIAFAALAAGPAPAAPAPPRAAAPPPAAAPRAPARAEPARPPQRAAARPDAAPPAPRPQRRAASGDAPAAPAPRADRRPQPAESAAPATEPRTAAARPAPRKAAAPAAGFVPPDEGEASDALQALRGHWDDIRDQARKLHFRAGALLVAAYPRSFDDDRVVLGFRFPNHVDMVRDAENGKVLQAVQRAVSDAVGREVTVEPALWEELAAGAPAPARQSNGGHLVDEARRLGAVPVDD